MSDAASGAASGFSRDGGAATDLAALPPGRWRAHSLGVIAGALGALPILALLGAGLFGSDGGATARLFETRLLDLALASGLLAVLVGLGAGALGAGLAWLVAVHRFPGRALFDWLLLLPLAAPAYLLAYAYRDLSTAAGPWQSALREATGWPLGSYLFPEVRGVLGAAFVFTLCLYPYVYVLARRAFSESAAPLLEAARTLGCGGGRAFARVAWPLAWPAVAAGAALAVMEALADYGAVSHLGVSTFTVGILRAWSAAGEPVAAARLALILVGVCLALLLLERLLRGRASAVSARSARRPTLQALPPGRGLLASAACGLVLLLAVGLPAGHLLGLAIEAGPARGLGPAAVRTLGLGLAAAVVLTAIGFGVASAARAGSRSAAVTGALLPAGYAMPGAAAALGVLALAGFAQSSVGIGLVAWGPLVLLLAYQTRFGVAAFAPIAASLARAPVSLDHAARTLGTPRSTLGARLHVRLAGSGIAAALLLIFIEVVKELPATTILRPFDFDTLAVLAHGYASEERLAQAASPALAILALCAPAMVLAARLAENRPR